MKQITLSELVAVSEDYDTRKVDTRFEGGDLRAYGKNISVDGMTPMPLTQSALTQLCTKLGYHTTPDRARLPADFLYKHATPEEFEFLMNYRAGMLKAKGGRKFLARTYSDDNGSHMRAILGAEYPLFGDGPDKENTMMLRAIANGVEQLGTAGDLARCEVTPDSINVRAFVREYSADQVGSAYNSAWAVGFYGGNSEVGDGSFEFRPAIKRTACNNSIVLSTTVGGKWSHIGSPVKFTDAIARSILDVIPAAMLGVQKMITAETIGVVLNDELDRLASAFGWKDKKTGSIAADALPLYNAVLIGTEGKGDTLAGLVNGVTYAAHNVKQDSDGQLAMELFAGALLERVRV